MSDNNEIKSGNTANTNGQQLISSSRRNFTKAGLLASPVLMSVVSRPVFGVGCLSNVLSGNLSDPNRGECSLGLSPGYWKEHPDAWPAGATSGYLPDGITVPDSCNICRGGTGSGAWECINGTKFNTVFTLGPQDVQNRSLHEILCSDSGSEAFHIIAAYLNALTDPTSYVLTVAQVKDLWQDYTLGGQILDMRIFLKGTWI